MSGGGETRPLLKMKYQTTTPPTWWPISLEDAKAHLRVSHTEEDAVIWDMLRAATEIVEREAWVQLNEKGITIYMDVWENVRLESFSPIQAVNSIKYYDANNTLQTLAASSYDVDLLSDPMKIDIDSTPVLYDKFNTVEIALTVGYTEDCKIPAGLANCVKMVLGDLYENRQNVSPTATHEIQRGTREMIGLFSKRHFV